MLSCAMHTFRRRCMRAPRELQARMRSVPFPDMHDPCTCTHRSHWYYCVCDCRSRLRRVRCIVHQLLRLTWPCAVNAPQTMQQVFSSSVACNSCCRVGMIPLF